MQHLQRSSSSRLLRVSSNVVIIALCRRMCCFSTTTVNLMGQATTTRGNRDRVREAASTFRNQRVADSANQPPPLSSRTTTTTPTIATTATTTTPVKSTKQREHPHREILRKIFSQYDENGDGHIEFAEMKNALTRAGVLDGTSTATADLESLFQAADFDNSGSIDFEEFCRLFESILGEDAGEEQWLNFDLRRSAEYWSQVAKYEIKDGLLVFETVMEKMIKEVLAGKERNLRFPREIMWLGGAPGSGKGTQTPFISKQRGISAPPIVMSDLLTSPEAKAIKDAGQLVGNTEVFQLLLTELQKPIYQNGVLVDGFPRTTVQVECVKLLYQRMKALHDKYMNTKFAQFFPLPVFRITVLFVDEKESVERQLNRGAEIIAHNSKVKETGRGNLIELRKTDISTDAALTRFRVFKEETFEALNTLKQYFHYHFINAMGTVDDVQRNIAREMLYQSSLELDRDTFAAIRHLKTTRELTLHARQNLVKRLNEYQADHKTLFHRVIKVIEEEFMPVITQHTIGGEVILISDSEVFQHKMSISMVLDILSDRGFRVLAYPQQYCAHTDQLRTMSSSTAKQQMFRVKFDRPNVVKFI